MKRRGTCKSEYKYLSTSPPHVGKLNTKYDTFTAPKTNNGRRNLALVHPISQLAISLLLTQHKAKIKKIISRSTASLYRTHENQTQGKAFAGLDFRQREILIPRICSKRAYILKADISRFFYTVYTHSIPWAILGKEKAKTLHFTKKLSSHWSSDFDKALQSCQSRETFGLPVGPDTSRVIAELILAGVETDPGYVAATKGCPSFRLLDDFFIGFKDEMSAQMALAALRKALWQFNLQLNEEKTNISRSTIPFNEKWKLDFESIILTELDERQ